MPGGTPNPSPTGTAVNAMSLVSSSTGIVPLPSNAMLNLRGRPYSSRWFRMWWWMRRASGRVSISSCASIPAVGLPVTLRTLSAPEPRAVRPISTSRVSTSGAPAAPISRICRLARVVTSA